MVGGAFHAGQAVEGEEGVVAGGALGVVQGVGGVGDAAVTQALTLGVPGVKQVALDEEVVEGTGGGVADGAAAAVVEAAALRGFCAAAEGGEVDPGVGGIGDGLERRRVVRHPEARG